jgi:hypothetical protein
MVWMFLIVFILKPDQILQRTAKATPMTGMRAIASIPFDLWILRTIRELAGGFVVLPLLNSPFVIARYGWLTLLSLGGVAVFETNSSHRKARR